MAQVKTSELTGVALDWAVAKCEHPKSFNSERTIKNIYAFKYSTDCAQSWPIIDREMREHGFDLWSGAHVPTGQFAATYCRGAPDSYVYGPTPLIAAMRCYVASKLGDTVEVPDELIK